ncbi:MAG: hypothetical protein K0R39_4763 [Symbiobacteriaceae bacterium]|nr:hypothetical protein [Symbiobacteriaceae bacterium]
MEEVSVLLKAVLGGLDELRAQVGGMQNAMHRVEERLGGVEEGLAALRRDVVERLDDIDDTLDYLESKYNAQEKEIHRLKRRDAR